MNACINLYIYTHIYIYMPTYLNRLDLRPNLVFDFRQRLKKSFFTQLHLRFFFERPKIARKKSDLVIIFRFHDFRQLRRKNTCCENNSREGTPSGRVNGKSPTLAHRRGSLAAASPRAAPCCRSGAGGLARPLPDPPAPAATTNARAGVAPEA